MTTMSRMLWLAIPALVLAGVISLTATDAQAITYGQQDCTVPADNVGCQFPETVSLSGFRLPTAADNTTEDLVSFGRCSGSLLSKDAERIVILTAGHCASGYLGDLQSGAIVDVGVSFDAVIERDVSQELGRWSADQYILGGQPVLPAEYGPQGVNASIIQFDHAVIVFEAPFTTHEGGAVDLSSIDPVMLAPLNFLRTRVGAGKTLPLTAVGYGTGEAHNKPGQGGNAGGAVNSIEEFGQRWYTDLTTAFSFMGPKKNLLLGSQNPALGDEGTCGGDSGGPLFYDNDGTQLQVGVTSSGDAICRATSIIARTESATALDFLECVLDGAEADSLPAIEACGCTEVNSQGECD
ncbi:MAG: trypsin-like serine protease [Dongiaceae bacterium]